MISLMIESGIYFREFDSPGEVYEYKFKSTEYQIIYGENTACVIGEEETLYLIRNNQKWKVPFNESSIAKCVKKIDDVMIYVHEYNNMDDYYITVLSYDNIEVRDNLKSEFFLINEIYYCTCVTKPDSDYVLYIDGEEYCIFK